MLGLPCGALEDRVDIECRPEAGFEELQEEDSERGSWNSRHPMAKRVSKGGYDLGTSNQACRLPTNYLAKPHRRCSVRCRHIEDIACTLSARRSEG